MTLHEALKIVIVQHGSKVILEPRFVNILADHRAFEEYPDTKEVIRQMISGGYMKRMYDIHNPSWYKKLFHTEPSNVDKFNRTIELKNEMSSAKVSNGDVLEYVWRAVMYGLGYSVSVRHLRNQINTQKRTGIIEEEKDASGISDDTNATQFLVVQVQPKNAKLFVDGELEALHDGDFAKEMSLGIYKIDITAEPDYFSYHTEVKLTLSKKAELRVALEERNPLLPLSITSDDSNCEIFIDNKNYGNSPCRCALRKGTYHVEIRKEGHNAKTYTIEVTKPHQKFNLSSGAPKVGLIKVNVPEIGVAVYLDKTYVGTNPIILRNVPVGTHQIGVTVNGGLMCRQITVVGDDEHIVSLDSLK